MLCVKVALIVSIFAYAFTARCTVASGDCAATGAAAITIAAIRTVMRI
jgi:hypothetical protein